MATDNKHFRRLTQKTSNVDDYTIEFPLELTQQDYLRRIFNQCGGAFLQISLSIDQTIREQNAADQELAVAAAFAGANQHDDGDIATTSALDEEVDAPDDEIIEEDKNGSPRSEATSTTPLFTPQAVRKCLSNILDDGAPKTPAPWKALTGNKKSKAYKTKEKKRQQKLQKELVKQQKHQAKQVQLQTIWSVLLSREISWIEERAKWLHEMQKVLEQSEMNYDSSITDTTIKREFQTAIDVLCVFGEADSNCQWYLHNVQQLRSQFMYHCKFRRERRQKEILADQKARGGTGVPNESGRGVNEDGTLQFNYTYDFDRKGILYYFGSNANLEEGKEVEGKQGKESKEGKEGKEGKESNDTQAVDDDTGWSNPSLPPLGTSSTPQIRAFRSSEGAGKATDICGRKSGVYSCTDYRKPRQYYGIDFGPFYRVYPNAYTLRHGSSQGILALRDWTFEGSQDGKKWFPIRKHRADMELPRLSYSTNTWKIEKNNQRRCRMLRVVQTKAVDVSERLHDSGVVEGKSNDATVESHPHPQHHALFLSGIEVYGRLEEI